MIKLTLPPKPAELTAEKQAELTARFKADPEAEVWKQSWIKTPLMTMTNDKCAYSEMKLGEEGKYAQIEHIHPKSIYKDEVVEWGNLIPSCNVCNIKKRAVDTKKHPIVNPLVDNPKDYFYINNGRLNVKDKKNQKAIDTLTYCDLNNYDQLRKKRVSIEESLKKRIGEMLRFYTNDKEYWSNQLLCLMKECGRKAAYSATKATLFLTSSDYASLKQQLVNDSRWNNDFVAAEAELEFCALPKS